MLEAQARQGGQGAVGGFGWIAFFGSGQRALEFLLHPTQDLQGEHGDKAMSPGVRLSLRTKIGRTSRKGVLIVGSSARLSRAVAYGTLVPTSQNPAILKVKR